MRKRMTERHERNTYLLLTAVIVFGFSIARRLPFNETGMIFGCSYNLFCYGLITAGSLTICFLAGLPQNSFDDKRLRQAYISAGDYLLFALCLVLIYFAYSKEQSILHAGADLKRSFVRENMMHSVFAAASLFLSVCYLQVLRRENAAFLIGNRRVRLLFAAAVSLAAALLAYAPNIYKNDMWGLYHIHAYCNSIVNAACLIPYSDTMESIYGHYGLLLIPFVRLFGNNLYAVMISIALLVFTTYMAAFVIISKLIKHDVLFILSLLAIFGTTVTYFGAGEYYQILPHRILFPMLSLWFVSEKMPEKEMKTETKITALILGTLSLIFNFETGICCVAVILLSSLAAGIGCSSRFSAKKLFQSVLFSVLPFIFAFTLINVYNLAVGGEWNSVRTMIYPIASEEYQMHEILRTTLKNPISGYGIQMTAFCVAVVYSLRRFKNAPPEKKSLFLVLFSTGISGLGSLTYFINRSAASCLAISHIQFLMVLCFFSQRARSNKPRD